MVNGAETLHQEVISDNEKIFQTILTSINGASREILVATSWFTDDTLFQALIQKRMQGIAVDLILGDNQENEKLDFSQLTEKGGNVIKVRNVGYGIMHQKFCVIDRNVALHGSYNWSINARKNNHESIIVTTHAQTIESLVKTFFEIKEKSLSFMSGEESANVKNFDVDRTPVSNFVKPVSSDWDSTTEFAKILDSMIAAEVSNFDRNLLHRQGYERSKSNNGDPQVLGKAFDSVYSVFINEINVVEDKKRRLISKIEEQKIRTLQSIKETTELQITTISTDFENTEIQLSKKIIDLKNEISRNEIEIGKIQQIQIPSIEQENLSRRQEITQLEQNYIRPSWKLYEIIPITFLNVFLLSYLILFYSSAAYILLFSERDAKEARMNGQIVPPQEVFDPDAISKVLEKEGTAMWYVLLFVAIPISFALIKISKNRIWTLIWSFLFGIMLLDGFIAYKVAKSIHEIEYLTGKIDIPWDTHMILQNHNFYLVFILGAMGLFLFKLAFERLTAILEERNPDFNTRKTQIMMKQLKETINSNKNQIDTLNERSKDIALTVLHMKNQIEMYEKEISMLPSRKAGQIEKKRIELAVKNQGIESTTVIYKSHIENDDLPISINSVKDRINVFLEGWNDWLYEEYADLKAREKCSQAVEAATLWFKEKLQTKIDQRISFV